VALDHRAHCAVKNQDAGGEGLLELGCAVHGYIISRLNKVRIVPEFGG
jgi:hypothetical protein